MKSQRGIVEATKILDPSQQRQLALLRWQKGSREGTRAKPRGRHIDVPLAEVPAKVPHFTNVELMQLHTRVIALENLVVALLAEKSGGQLNNARKMAAYISPRAGFTQHPLTIHATTQMLHLVERAGHFLGKPNS